MAFPKAGLELAGLPLTINLLLLACVVLVNVNGCVLAMQKIKDFGFVYLALCFFGLTTIVLGLASGSSAFQLSQMIVVLVSPLAGVAVIRVKPELFFKLVCVALIVVNVYGMIQFVVGISQATIPGLTLTYGQDIETKNIGYNAATDGGNKIPSTYQNGNSVGIFNVLAVSYLLSPIIPNRWWKTRVVSVVCGLIGLLLCGSRSILIPFAVLLIFVLKESYQRLSIGRRKTAVTVLTIGSVLLMLVLALQRTIIEQFWNRNVLQTIDDPTAAGRTNQWAGSFHRIQLFDGGQLLRLFLFGKDSSMELGGEGLPRFFFTFGLPATLLFYGGLLLVAYRCWCYGRRTLSLGLLCIVFAFSVDTTYFFPPNLMMFFIFAMTAITEHHLEVNEKRKLFVVSNRMSVSS
jgi:hypothetical protein